MRLLAITITFTSFVLSLAFQARPLSRKTNFKTDLRLTPPPPLDVPSDWSTTSCVGSSSVLTSGVVDVIQNISVGIVGFAAVIFGIAFLFTNFIIPKAAEQLEAQARTQYPDLWREYARKLEPGETLASRPDIIQDLGNRVQARVNEEFDAKQKAIEAKKKSDGSKIVDAEFQKDE